MARKKITATLSVPACEIDVSYLVMEMVEQCLANDTAVSRAVRKEISKAVAKAVSQLGEKEINAIIRERVKRAATGATYL